MGSARELATNGQPAPGDDLAAGQPGARTPRSRLRACVYCLAGFLLWLLLDAAIFRSDLYPSILEPESAAGNFELLFWNEMHRKPTGHPEIAGIGDSRLPLLPRVANELTPRTGYTFTNVGVPGTSPRCWYYRLRDLDPAAQRYAAIVFAVDSYDDEDGWGIRLTACSTSRRSSRDCA
jgi:hypothetical protein